MYATYTSKDLNTYFHTASAPARLIHAYIAKRLYWTHCHTGHCRWFYRHHPDDDHIDNFKFIIWSEYSVTYISPPTTLLGWIVLLQVTGAIHLSQPVWIYKSIEKVDLLKSNPRSAPFPNNPDFKEELKSTPVPVPAIQLYQCVLGDLRYLTYNTWLDVSVSGSGLEQHLIKPRAE